MKSLKKALALLLVGVMFVTMLSVSASAASYGAIIPVNSKATKAVSTVNLYGSYDYIDFIVSSESDNTYFAFGIYSDKNYTKLVGEYIEVFDKGEYYYTPYLNLKGYKSGTYYAIAFACKQSGNSVSIDENSAVAFTIKINRTTSFAKQVVILKETSKNTVNGHTVYWNKLPGAVSYVVYRRSANSTKWTKLGTTKGTSFTDKTLKAKSGEYVYTVRGMNKSKTLSRYHYLGIQALVVGAPTVKSVKVSGNDHIVSWSKISGVKVYLIYRKENSGGWSRVGAVTNGATSFKDTKAKKAGVKYTYTVRAERNFYGVNVKSSYYSGKSINFMTAPTITSVATTSDNINIVKWKAVSGAKYDVYRKENGGSWVRLATGVASASYNDKTSKVDGANYVYTVRATKNKIRSHYLPGKGIDFTGAPKLLAVEPVSEGAQINWLGVASAESYTIYVKPADGSSGWVNIGKAEKGATSFIDTENYGPRIYTVRAEGKTTRGSYSSKGIEYNNPNEPIKVVDAVNYEKDVVDNEGLGEDFKKHYVILPKITSDTDNAKAFNELLANPFFFGYEVSVVEALKQGLEDNRIIQLDYEASVENNIAAISVKFNDGYKSSSVDTYYNCFYFDANQDKALTVDEYIAAKGMDKAALLEAAESTEAYKNAFEGEFPATAEFAGCVIEGNKVTAYYLGEFVESGYAFTEAIVFELAA